MGYSMSDRLEPVEPGVFKEQSAAFSYGLQPWARLCAKISNAVWQQAGRYKYAVNPNQRCGN